MDFRVVIPARYASTRFPGKALADLAGEPVIQHVFRRAQESGAREILIATDDQRIAAAAQAFGADVIMTSADHATGTDRIAAVVDQQGWPADDIVVNLQGDAPLIPGRSIKQVATLLAEHPSAAMATLCVLLADEAEYRDPNVVKVVFDNTGRALYFSRGSIPARAHGHEALPSAWRHIGLYAYRADALKTLASVGPCALEQAEKLEQLRALWHGLEIRVGIAAEALGPDVDTPEDLAAAAEFIARQPAS